VLAVTSYNDRVIRMPGDVDGLSDGVLDDAGEFDAAVDYLLSVADEERALRNFTGMLPENSTFPLGSDDSYYVGSVWIAPPSVDAAPDERTRLDAPELDPSSARASATTVTLEPPAPSLLDAGAAVEYRCYVEGASYGAWQASPVFTGLSPDTAYLFQARYVASDDTLYIGSAAGGAVEVRTRAGADGAPGSGDLDGDGEATMAEVLAVAHTVIGLGATLDAAQAAAADINGDGRVSMADAVLLVRMIAGG
jgi:hypothetical protein